MDLYVLRTSAAWERSNGAAAVIAESLEHVEVMLREYESEEQLRVYPTEDEAAVDALAPFRHVWVEVERFPVDEQAERIVVVSWDEAP